MHNNFIIPGLLVSCLLAAGAWGKTIDPPAGSALGKTIYVPDDCPTIQGSINAAADRDTIIVRSGTYMEVIDFLGKAITLTSELGPDVTSIDGCQAGSVVTFNNGEGIDSVLEGFTITNGSTGLGGGIHCRSSSPLIANNIVSDNRADIAGGIFCALDSSPVITGNIIMDNIAVNEGGAVWCHESDPVISDNTITGNSAQFFSGGAIYCWNSNAVITNNVISDNRAESHTSGGIHCRFSGLTIADNIITGNTATSGGGVYCLSSDTTISGNVITENAAQCLGGGIYCVTSNPVISDNTFSNNSAVNNGGAIYSHSSDPYLLGNTITDNTADNCGGAICCHDSSPTITGNTFSRNLAKKGGGLFCSDSSPIITNTIFWNNNATEGFGHEIRLKSGFLDVTYCNVKGGTTKPWFGTGCINSKPLFVDASNGNYHLRYDSPCREAGLNSAPGLPAYDFEGDPRISNSTVDIGSDEFHPHLYSIGDCTPGSRIKLNIIGTPGTSPVKLVLGAGLREPPKPIQYGELSLLPPFLVYSLNPIPSNGVSVIPMTIPSSWQSGEEYLFQALVGSDLTNLMTLFID